MEHSICERYKSDLTEFQNWVKSQPQIPQNWTQILLLRYLQASDFNQNKAKALLMLNLSTRKENPHVFNNRSIDSERVMSARRTLQVTLLPRYTNEKRAITIGRLIDCDAANFNFVDIVTLFFLQADARYVAADPEVGITVGEIGILDFHGFTLKHFFKILANISTLRLYIKYLQEAIPIKVHQNHFVNCSPVLSKILGLARPFMNKELFDVMHFHSSGYESLYEFIPRDFLPDEYGGKAGPIDEIYKTSVKIMERQRDRISDDSYWNLL